MAPVYSHFDAAIRYLLDHEGGYVDDPHDPGGATNYGISLRYLKGQGLAVGDFDDDGDIDIDDIRAMSKTDAEKIYRDQWWDKYQYGKLHDQRIATKVLDLAVNMGAHQAHKLLQRAVRSCGSPVAEDGILGEKTFFAVNGTDGACLLTALRSEAAGYYRTLVTEHGDFERFITGWLNRAYS